MKKSIDVTGELKVSYEDIMKEIEGYQKKHVFSIEQDNFLIACRNKGIKWEDILPLWNKVDGWRKYTQITTLFKRHKEITKNIK